MAKDDGVGSAGAIFVISKTAAQEKLDAESAEKLRTDPQGMKPVWLSRVGDVDTGRSIAISGHGLGSAGMVAPVEELRGARSRNHTLRQVPLDSDQPLGIRVRQGLEQP